MLVPSAARKRRIRHSGESRNPERHCTWTPASAGVTAIRFALLAVCMGVAAVAAQANPLDTYGFGARAIGMGGGFTAAASGTEALYYNPAGLARVDRPLASLGVLTSRRTFRARGAADRDEWLSLVQAGLATPLPLGRLLERRVFLGLALSLPTAALYDVVLPDDRSAFFPLIGDRDRRLVANLGLGARVLDWLQVGAGLTLLPDVHADVLVDLRDVGGLNRARVLVEPVFAGNAGVRAQPWPWLALGLAWRGAQHTRIDLSPVRVDVASNLDPVQASVTAPAYAMPHQVALGAEVTPSPAWTVALDLTWSRFATWQAPSPEVALCAPCPRDCSAGDCPGYCTTGVCAELFRDQAPSAGFHDTSAPRAGLEWRPTEALALRAGYGLVPSPVPAQSGATSFLDGTRHVIALGAGYVFRHLPELFPASLALDAHLQAQVMPAVGWAKDVTDADGDGSPDLYQPKVAGQATTWPTLQGSALLLSAGVDLRVEF
jgi:long-chain fatty acid transport protein